MSHDDQTNVQAALSKNQPQVVIMRGYSGFMFMHFS